MKSISTAGACAAALAVTALVGSAPCRASDYINYSVPFAVQPAASAPNPVVSTTFSDIPARDRTAGPGDQYRSLEVRQYAVDIGGLDWALGPNDGVELQFGAAQYDFLKGPSIGIPQTESDFHAHLGLWRRLAPQWTVAVSANADMAGDGPSPGGHGGVRPGLGAALRYNPRQNLLTYVHLAAARIDGTTYVSPSAGLVWGFAPRWQLASGLSYSLSTPFPRTVIRYKPFDWLQLYGGLVTEGNVFDVHALPGVPRYLEYRQREVKIGVDLKAWKSWRIGLSLGYSLHQEFFRRR